MSVTLSAKQWYEKGDAALRAGQYERADDAFRRARHRPHRALGLTAPTPRRVVPPHDRSPSTIQRHDLLGGLLHEYALAA
jgi:hypothetical protein